MKKIFSILFLFAICLTAVGQNKVYSFTGKTGGAVKDSVINTGADTMIIHSVYSAKTVTIQPVITKVSGTIAGTLWVQGSLDGTNYINIPGDTIHCSDQATNTAAFVITDNPYFYYRTVITGVGTMKAYIKSYFLPSRQSGSAAATYNLTSSYGLSIDTVTNSGTNTVKLEVKNFYETVSIQAIVSKISGTAAGTVTLQGSNDGTNFVTVDTKYLSTLAPYFTTGAAATLSVSNTTTNTGIWVVKGSPYEYYRLSYTGSGTMVCTLKGVLLPSK